MYTIVTRQFTNKEAELRGPNIAGEGGAIT